MARSDRLDSRFTWLTPLLLLTVAVIVRAIYLNQPMRYDESVTALLYVNGEFWDAISKYNAPNNHLLHSALAHIIVGIVGQRPTVLRLPALVGGLATVLLTWRAGLRFATASAALVAALLVAFSSTEILYSTNARGYSILGAFWLVAVLAGQRLRSSDNPSRNSLLLGCSLALAMATIPTALFGIPGLILWSFAPLRSRPRREFARLALLTLGPLAGVTALCYAPVLARSGWSALTHNDSVAPQSLMETVPRLPEFLGSVLSDWTVGLPTVVAIVLGVGLLRGLVRWRSPLPSLFLATLAGALVVVLAMRRVPMGYGSYPRVWLFLFPIAALVATEGVMSCWDEAIRALRLDTLRPSRWRVVAWGTLLAASLVALVGGKSVFRRRDTGALRAAQQILIDLANQPLSTQSVVYSLSLSEPILVYYSLVSGNMVYPDHHLVPPAGAVDGWLIVNTGESQTVSSVQAAAARRGICVPAPSLVRSYVDAELWHGVTGPCISVAPH